MEIAYKAQTETCTLLLDANGICRSVVAGAEAYRGRPARIPSSAERCIGAQYVATLDFRDPGGLTHTPEPGAPMLFARIEPDGRITLVRSAKLVTFEAVAHGESGVRERPEHQAVRYDDDEERTTPIELEELTMPRVPSFRATAANIPRISEPPRPMPRSEPPRRSEAPRTSRMPDAPRMSEAPRASSAPPPRSSTKVPVARAPESARVAIPPPAPVYRTPRTPIAPLPAVLPRRPSLARVNPPAYDGPTLPFRRAAR